MMSHGGNLRALALRSECSADEIIDFSASINPLGPPTAVSTILSRAADLVLNYPDPEATELRDAIATQHGCGADQVVIGNGSSELLSVIGHAFPNRTWVISDPCYSGYERVANAQNAKIQRLPRTGASFDLDWASLEKNADSCSLVVLDHPNNPTGKTLDPDRFKALLRTCPEAIFVIDESFAPFINADSTTSDFQADNVIMLRSMTKFFAIPGLRLGYAIASRETATKLSNQLPEWNVNAIALAVGQHCIGDDEYSNRSRKLISSWRSQLQTNLTAIPGVEVLDSSANFLLCRLRHHGFTAASLAERLLSEDRIAIRVCGSFEGLGEDHFRVAVKTETENERLVNGLRRILAASCGQSSSPPRRRRAPALMIQGVSSNAGKSILAAAFCRILAREGYRVAPFKSQNMSLNSFVTRDGHEISRAQVVQAQAAKLEPDVRMNPILLKPNSQTGSQVILDGQPVGNMRVKEYYQFKPTAFEHAKRSYDSLAHEYDVMVLEGAGSPGEVNLKRHDIVNMNMARHANASVLLVGDIDRGGVFASFVGTMAVLESWERKLVSGYVINRFRGDASLLEDAYTYMLDHTGKPILGTVPNIDEIGIPDEDSVSFKKEVHAANLNNKLLDVAVVDLPHISNLSDFDPLRAEPDVHVRTVREINELGTPDVLILPGTRNTIDDLTFLRDRGFFEALRSARQLGTELVGICGGFQMLGKQISDRLGIESHGHDSIEGLGLLDVATEMAVQKRLRQISGTHADSGLEITGYEIHHGQTQVGDVNVLVAVDEEPISVSDAKGLAWGTYLHGTFEQDGFRRWFLDRVRDRKGMPALGQAGASYQLDAAYDRLADVVSESIDLDNIRRILGL